MTVTRSHRWPSGGRTKVSDESPEPPGVPSPLGTLWLQVSRFVWPAAHEHTFVLFSISATALQRQLGLRVVREGSGSSVRL